MKKLLFGWLLKPNYLVTTLDSFIGFIEVSIIVTILLFILYLFVGD